MQVFSVAIAEYLRSTFYVPKIPKVGRSRQLENTVRKLGIDPRIEVSCSWVRPCASPAAMASPRCQVQVCAGTLQGSP